LAALQSATALLAAPWTDRVPKQRLVPWHWASLALGYAALAIVSTTTGLWFAISVYGLLSGISEGVERALVSEQAGLAGKGTAFGWYYLLTGGAAIAAGLMFGALWQVAGPSSAFGAAAAAALACSLGLRTIRAWN
jgi:MFS family permease